VRLQGRAPAYGVLAAAGAAALVVLVLGLVTVGALGGGPSIAASAGESSVAGPQLPTATAVSTAPEADWPTPWLQVLRALDVRRSSAFRKVDDAELDAVYIRGSVPWKADKELLATYRNQRLRIEGLTMEIRSLSIELEDTNHAVLHVVDRLASGTAVDQTGRRTTLPAGKPTSRRITLEAPIPGTWRISGITTL
jgi:hypothetical protein